MSEEKVVEMNETQETEEKVTFKQKAAEKLEKAKPILVGVGIGLGVAILTGILNALGDEDDVDSEDETIDVDSTEMSSDSEEGNVEE